VLFNPMQSQVISLFTSVHIDYYVMLLQLFLLYLLEELITFEYSNL